MARSSRQDRISKVAASEPPPAAAVLNTVAQAAPEALTQHGPIRPAAALYGAAHLRRVLNLSASVTVDQLCEDAALELTQLRERAARPARWT